MTLPKSERICAVRQADCCKNSEEGLSLLSEDAAFERVEHAQREARPDSRAKIERHPRDLFFPLCKIVCDDPTGAHVTKTFERPQALVAFGDIRPPPF